MLGVVNGAQVETGVIRASSILLTVILIALIYQFVGTCCTNELSIMTDLESHQKDAEHDFVKVGERQKEAIDAKVKEPENNSIEMEAEQNGVEAEDEESDSIELEEQQEEDEEDAESDHDDSFLDDFDEEEPTRSDNDNESNVEVSDCYYFFLNFFLSSSSYLFFLILFLFHAAMSYFVNM